MAEKEVVVKRAKFRGKEWSYHVVPRRDIAEVGGNKYDWLDGITESPEDSHRRLFVAENLRGEHWLEVHIHEALHACCWDLSEDAVTETARDIARFLTRLGVKAP